MNVPTALYQPIATVVSAGIILAVATLVYRWQKNIDNFNQRRAERREIYRRYATAVEAFRSAYPSCSLDVALEKIALMKQVEAELVVSLPPKILPANLVSGDLAIDLIIHDLELELFSKKYELNPPTSDGQLKKLIALSEEAERSKDRFINYIEATLQSMRLDSLVNIEVASPFMADMREIEKRLNLMREKRKKVPEEN
ncbi:hypothetical protein [Meridianimarinicoccus aquatilis]|uniref:Uncharacterized protein n=1 Tax=Meridianimarinicoccus aquatilis TaxID=2552766 RepID=A0A4R6AQR3_9RHOB|nr:hypothetical protein [Fluviibacterium aquatile]TDL85794.1 hypothetical protein E2L05_14710 [Fluviibacterium aquatile]